ncbi:MAG: glycosyltransferase family 2 protein [Parcubacteria group bacterium]|jgi:hyaluronan synthase
MNVSQSETIEQVFNQPFAGYRSRISWRDIFYQSAIILSGGALIFLIILLKSKTSVEFQVEPYFFSYAIFVTTFLLSRIITSMFYKNSLKTLVAENNGAQPQLDDYQPKVAFVIPCKNEEQDIGDSVIKCYKIKYPKDKIEVIVVNDGSTDRTMLILRELQKYYPSLMVIDWPENQGKRWGMAAGFQISDAEIIIQLDSDSSLDPDSFQELIAPFKNPEISAVCAHGIPKNADKNILTKMQTAYYFMSFRILKAAESTFNTVFCCSGCCSAYRKSDVMPVIFSWLGEGFLGLPVTWGDDRALTSHLLKAGKKTVYASDAIAHTIVPEKWRILLRQQLRWKKSWIINSIFTSRFIAKKQPFVAFFYYLPLVIISFLTPIMTFRALIFIPFTKGTLPLYHIAGVLLITAIMVIYYKYLDRKNKYWPYLFLWSVLNLFVLSFVIVWAAVKIQDRGWGTR